MAACGRLRLDRSKDLIISSGANIYPRDVDEVASAVAGRGMTLDVEALDRVCLEHIARFKRPKRYHVVKALPKNNYGKVLEVELRSRLEQACKSAWGTFPIESS